MDIQEYIDNENYIVIDKRRMVTFRQYASMHNISPARVSQLKDTLQTVSYPEYHLELVVLEDEQMKDSAIHTEKDLHLYSFRQMGKFLRETLVDYEKQIEYHEEKHKANLDEIKRLHQTISDYQTQLNQKQNNLSKLLESESELIQMNEKVLDRMEKVEKRNKELHQALNELLDTKDELVHEKEELEKSVENKHLEIQELIKRYKKFKTLFHKIEKELVDKKARLESKTDLHNEFQHFKQEILSNLFSKE
jgi:chromosome segregation ATPase